MFHFVQPELCRLCHKQYLVIQLNPIPRWALQCAPTLGAAVCFEYVGCVVNPAISRNPVSHVRCQCNRLNCVGGHKTQLQL